MITEIEEKLEIVIGVEALKDKFRHAKLKMGDLRGLKNRFALSRRLDINEMHTAFYSFGGNGDMRMECYADITVNGHENSLWAYSIKEMIEEIYEWHKEHNEFEIQMCCAKWNKERTDADRVNVGSRFIFKKK